MAISAVYVTLISCIVMLSHSAILVHGQQLSKKAQKPNILLIVSEDHGAHLSCYGDPVIQTPHLDNIAKQGMLFRNAYVTQSVCSSRLPEDPSNCSILARPV